MNIVEGSLKKVKRVLRLTSFIYSLTSALLAFFIFSVLLVFFSISWLYALIPAAVHFVYEHTKKTKKYGYGDVEKKIPELAWRLRTSADNRHRHDALASSLHKDVMQKIGLVKLSKFLSSRHMLYKFTAVVGLAVLLTFVQVKGVTLESVQPTLEDNALTDFFSKNGENLLEFTEAGEEAPEELFGEVTTPEYGEGEELMELSQMQGLVGIEEYDPNKQGKTFIQQSAGQAGKAVTSGASGEKVSEKNKNIVENYFKGIRKN